MSITDEQVHQWLQEQCAASGVPHLMLGISTEYNAAPFSAKIAGSSAHYGFGQTAREAIERLRGKLPGARERARRLRLEAALKAKEADALETYAETTTPAEVIADKEGWAA